MTERYIATVARVIDEFQIVVNRGTINGFKLGDKFLVVGMGNIIIDPETNEELGKLEIVKGEVEVIHTQDKISTLKSCRYNTPTERKEIVKRRPSNTNVFGNLNLLDQGVITESIIPGERYLLELDNPKIGDFLIKK